MNTDSLTLGAISKLLSSDAEEQSIIVQVFNIVLTKSGRLICMISDGNFFAKAFVNDDEILKANEDENTVICIKTHGALKNSVGITKFERICQYPEKLGNPKDWNEFKENICEPEFNLQFKLDNMSIKIQPKPTKKQVQIENLQKTEERKATHHTNEEVKTPGKTSEYESITDLHIGFTRWTILCRITRKTLKESTKKGLKILEIQLVDKSKKKIIGTFFGEAATQFNDSLREQAVYEISKGRIREGNYNNSKNQMISPYTLIFDNKAIFNEVSDVNVIVKNEDTSITLGELYERNILHQDFDIVAYVVQVKAESSYQKNDKNYVVKDLVIADPFAKLCMNARLWRWSQQLPGDIVGKVIIFSRFALNEYKGSISISSNHQSSLILTHDHPMRRFEGSNIDISEYKCTTEIRERTEENSADFCLNTRTLAEKISYMSDGDTIKSILYVWVTRMALSRKWCYESCPNPKCKKVAEKYSKCQHCGLVIEDTNLSFTMGVEISDFSGSIWITAYDELAKKIFHDRGANVARELNAMPKQQLMETIENYHYQPLKIKVITKKDDQGRIRHNAGYLYELTEQKTARDNLKQINEMLGYTA